MNIHYNVTGAERKALATALGEILNQPVIYRGTPSFSYEIGEHIIDRNGALTYPADMRTNKLVWVIARLKERGYEMAEDEEMLDLQDVPEPDADTDDSNKLVIEIPLDGFTDKAIENLGEIVASKNQLIKKTLGVDSLQIDIADGKLSFPWFILTGADGEMDAYLRFITAICKMAKNQKRVSAKERPLENDKFTMRLFLIRLGFVGSEFKAARKILLKNLTGNTAWKDGQRPERRVDEL